MSLIYPLCSFAARSLLQLWKGYKTLFLAQGLLFLSSYHQAALVSDEVTETSPTLIPQNAVSYAHCTLVGGLCP